VLLIALLLNDCGSTKHTDYSYTEIVEPYELGFLKAKLRGTQKNINSRNSENGAPYELLLWFSIEYEKYVSPCSVIINKLDLVDPNNRVESQVGRRVEVVFSEKSSGKSVASFSFKDVQVMYSEQQLVVIYSLHGECSESELPVKKEFLFETNYQEREVSFWDVIMGV